MDEPPRLSTRLRVRVLLSIQIAPTDRAMSEGLYGSAGQNCGVGADLAGLALGQLRMVAAETGEDVFARGRTSTRRPSTAPKSSDCVLHSVGIGRSSNLRKVVAAQQLSLIRRPDAPICLRNAR
jgi:hypothetical protein